MFIGLRWQECGHGPSLFEWIHECLIILLDLVVVERVIPSHEGHPYLMFNGWNIQMKVSWCDCIVCRSVVTCLCRVQSPLELYSAKWWLYQSGLRANNWNVTWELPATLEAWEGLSSVKTHASICIDGIGRGTIQSNSFYALVWEEAYRINGMGIGTIQSTNSMKLETITHLYD